MYVLLIFIKQQLKHGSIINMIFIKFNIFVKGVIGKYHSLENNMIENKLIFILIIIIILTIIIIHKSTFNQKSD